ncbi:hypothetical protein DPMN_015988 [Dreissena polymorpha]|uniref:Uncharacterized protein n=1 Tax=Dreissena polymorpha TaxID=45954 RepID=A0A9D4NCB3_DREPO|nr:hypothetical protein DPMN_015988 [Dreissena polymorpha]
MEMPHPFARLHPMRQGNLSPGNPKRRGRVGGLEKTVAASWMKMQIAKQLGKI